MIKGRSFTALDLVRLPRLNANNAQTLGRAVIAAGEKATLSEGAKEAFDDVTVAVRNLVEVAHTQRLGEAEPADSKAKTLADSQLDSAWVGTYDWLNGWARLPDEPKAQIAAKLRERLFPDGLKFTRYTYTEQWAESNMRLTLVEEADLEKTFDALGGAPFLESLRAKHEAYGEALGVTQPQDDPVQAQKVRDALNAFADTLRDYVLQVSAMARKSNPDSQALVDKLLAPITNWRSGPVAKASPAQATTEPAAGEDGEKGERDCAE